MFPVRCFSCGKPIGAVYEEYKQRTDKGEDKKKVLKDLGIERYCCKAIFLGNAELIDTVAKFKKA